VALAPAAVAAAAAAAVVGVVVCDLPVPSPASLVTGLGHSSLIPNAMQRYKPHNLKLRGQNRLST
jgi:hypothetical protein